MAMTLVQSHVDQYLPLIVANFTSTKLQVTIENKDSNKTYPYMQTQEGTQLSQLSAIAYHIVRSSQDQKLLGISIFNQAKINQWVSWAESIYPVVQQLSDLIYNTPSKFDQKKYEDLLTKIQNYVVLLDNELKNKKWIVGDDISLADIITAALLTPLFLLSFDKSFQDEVASLTKWYKSFISLPEVVKAAGHIKICENPILPIGAKEVKRANVKKEEKKEDDLDDLFGDDDVDEESAAAAKKVAEIAKEASKKKAKKEVIAMSLVMLEVKPLDDTTNLDDLAKKIFTEIIQDGLFWKTEYKKEPVAFGIYKLIVGFSCEDEKVSVDDIVEKIEALDEFVQSVEISSFNKI